jgi:hypothetical protein
MADVPPMPKEEASPVNVESESELEAKPEDVGKDECSDTATDGIPVAVDATITTVEKSISDEEREAIVNHFNKIVESKSLEPTATVNAAINGDIIDE